MICCGCYKNVRKRRNILSSGSRIQCSLLITTVYTATEYLVLMIKDLGLGVSFQGLKDLLNPCVCLVWWEQAVLLPCRLTTVYLIISKGTEL